MKQYIQLKNSWVRKIQLTFLLFVLIFNSTFSVLVAAYNTDQAQSYTKADAVLICSGTSFKWMSKSAFIEKGVVQYIEEPEDIPSQYHEIKCSYSYLVDHYNAQVSAVSDLEISEIKYRSLVTTIAQRPYTSFTYSKALSRAPPYNI